MTRIEKEMMMARMALPKPIGEPPEGALKDVDGKFIVDRRGKYIVTTEN